MQRVVLILTGATYRADDFLAVGRTLNVEIVVATDTSQALATAMGDHYIPIDVADPEGSAGEIASRGDLAVPIDAIVAPDDSGVEIAALVGERLAISHNPVDAVLTTRDKVEMRRRFAAAGVTQPDFRVLRPEQDPGNVAGDLGYPVVVKPISLSASRGVLRADDARSVASAVTRIRRILDECGEDPAADLLVEQYVAGAEVAVEGLLAGGRLRVLAILDKPEPMEGPTFEETLFVTPSRPSAAVQSDLIETATAAATALGLTDGPIHAEFRIGRNGITTLEIAARSIGGLCGRTLHFGLLGSSLETVILRQALGFPQQDISPSRPASGVLMLPIPRSGTLTEVTGTSDASAVPNVEDVSITIPIGHRVRALPEDGRYLGFVFAAGAHPAEVEHALRTARDLIDIVIT